jgi:hypothetical protein
MIIVIPSMVANRARSLSYQSVERLEVDMPNRLKDRHCESDLLGL